MGKVDYPIKSKISDNARIAKNSLILYFRLILVLLIGVLSSRFILQALGTSDFGLYSVVGGIVSMMAVINNVMVSTTYRFIAIELGTDDNDKINRVYNISLVIHIILALFILLLAETFGIYYIKHYLNIMPNKLSDALFVFHLSILSTVAAILSVPCQGLIFAKEKFSITALIEIIRSLLALGTVLIVLFYTGNKLRLYALLIAIISILPSLLYYLYTRYQFSSLIIWNFQKEKNRYKEMVGYSGWLMFGAAASAGEIQGSVIIINLFFGTVMNASYGIANQVNTMVKMFAQSLNQAVIPQINKSWGGGNKERTMKLAIFSSKYAFFLMLFPSLPILLETDYVLKLWLKEVPEYTSIFIQIMIANALISTMNSGIYAAIQATGKIKYFQIIFGTFVLMGLPVSYILFKLRFPTYTILLVYTVIYIINFFAIQILLKQIINFDIKEFYHKAYSRIIIVSLALAPLFFMTNIFDSSFHRFIIISLLSLFWLLIVIYLFGIGRNERIQLGDYLGKIIHRNRLTSIE